MVAMKERVMWAKARRNDLLLLGFFMLGWMLTIYELITRIKAMSLGTKVTSWMAFLILPIEIWRIIHRLREQTS
jgi:hypothetical protein